jgi:hypothetical protein
LIHKNTATYFGYDVCCSSIPEGGIKYKLIQNALFSENLKESDHLIDEDIDGKIILKRSLKFLGYDDGK